MIINRNSRHTSYAGTCKVCAAKVESTVTLRLWVIEYNLKDIGKGCAVVKAANAKRAEETLKASGTYNGTPHKYDIIRIEEIICPPAEDLIAEQYVSYFES